MEYDIINWIWNEQSENPAEHLPASRRKGTLLPQADSNRPGRPGKQDRGTQDRDQ